MYKIKMICPAEGAWNNEIYETQEAAHEYLKWAGFINITPKSDAVNDIWITRPRRGNGKFIYVVLVVGDPDETE